MHFFYLDEAGCTGAKLNDRNQPIFTLGGISVSDEKWMKTNSEFLDLIKSYFTTIPRNFELHTSDLLAQNRTTQIGIVTKLMNLYLKY